MNFKNSSDVFCFNIHQLLIRKRFQEIPVFRLCVCKVEPSLSRSRTTQNEMLFTLLNVANNPCISALPFLPETNQIVRCSSVTYRDLLSCDSCRLLTSAAPPNESRAAASGCRKSPSYRRHHLASWWRGGGGQLFNCDGWSLVLGCCRLFSQRFSLSRLSPESQG